MRSHIDENEMNNLGQPNVSIHYTMDIISVKRTPQKPKLQNKASKN